MKRSMSQRSLIAGVVLSAAALAYAGVDTGVWNQIKTLETQHKTDIANLDSQMAPLRQQIQSAEGSLKPLQSQRETLNQQFGDQHASLMDQVKPGFQTAYQSEKSQLDAAKSAHDQAIAGANQAYTSQRQQITAQFDAAIKGLAKKS